MAQIWLISDTHFGHANMYKFTGMDGTTRVRHKFDSVEYADEWMLSHWNEIVRPSDHVYHLGDVAMDQKGLQIVKHLHGHLRLVLGNHDRLKMQEYINVGFKKIFGSRKIDDLLLTHIPIHDESIPHWSIGNVHGHIHERPDPSPKHLNISVEQINYTPIAIEDVRQKLKEKQQ